MLKFLLALCALVSSVASQPKTLRTPSEYKRTLFNVGLSVDGTKWVDVLTSDVGVEVDLADAASFSRALSASVEIPAGTYKHVRMTLSEALVWSHPAAPVSLSNQIVNVNGPPGPKAGQMTVYFATHDRGGKPRHDNVDEGTETHPFLLGTSAEIRAGLDTVLRLVFLVSNTLIDQGSGNYDLAPPSMFFVTENADAARLAGNFNTVLYNTRKRTSGNTIDEWTHMSGHGVLVFDGAGSWSWNGTTNSYDLLNRSGGLTTTVQRSGYYGVSANGSFWMTVTGEAGTLQGAISSDGKIVLASMFDSQSSHMMIVGVQGASAATLAALVGEYYFATYGSRNNSGANRLRYIGTFGVVTGAAGGQITGQQDANEVEITDPAGTPSFTVPQTSLGSAVTDTLSITVDGRLSSASGSLGGALLESGDAGCLAFDFGSPYSSNLEFGFLVKKSPASTFSAASLNGTYYGGHFGDVYGPTNGGTSSAFSGFFQITFDGSGGAQVKTVENREGVINTDTQQATYAVDSTTGIVTFSDGNGGEAKLEGAIGPDAESFVLCARHTVSGQPNEERFLGLGVRQR